MPLRLATVLAIQAVIYLIMPIPVMIDSMTGNPIHHGFGKRLVSVITLDVGKGNDDIV